MVLEEAEITDEKELEYLLKSNVEQIEKGLKVVGSQIRTPKGRLDILCRDFDDVLTVIELKTTTDEEQLQQA